MISDKQRLILEAAAKACKRSAEIKVANMLVAKLSTWQIVRVLKESQPVQFSEFEHVLVNDNLNARQQRWKPYWVLATLIAWRLTIGN